MDRSVSGFIVCLNAASRIILFVDEELTDATFPCAQIRQELLKGLDAPLCEGDDAFVGADVDTDQFTALDAVDMRDLCHHAATVDNWTGCWIHSHGSKSCRR